jgi:hypothetical protein
MKPPPGQWDSLRLAAKACDRGRAAEALRPAFEKRLTEFGYTPLAIAHAFSALTREGTVGEALAELTENHRREQVEAVPLEFDVVEREPALPAGHSLTITGVERDCRGIRITYEIQPPLSLPSDPPRVETQDDCGQQSGGLGRSIGVAGPKERTIMLGSFTVPIPQPDASLLRVRMSWAQGFTSLWEHPAHEVQIRLPGSRR